MPVSYRQRSRNSARQSVQATVKEGLLRVTLNRPEKHNALSRKVLNTLRKIFEAHAADETLHAAVLSGAGDSKVFVGGTIPAEDHQPLREQGVSAIFTAEMKLGDILAEIEKVLA